MTNNGRWITAVTAMLIIASMLFLICPQIDLVTSRMFYKNGHFLFEKNGFGAVFTVYIHTGMRVVFFAYAILGLIRLAVDRFPNADRNRTYALIMASVIIAAGLVTNFILKDHWGRARPLQIMPFGGNRLFTPAWMISDQCRTNCSFVGGDVSFAFCALAAALTAMHCRTLWIGASVVFGILVAFGRIAAGAHFLSDCVIAGLLTSLIVLILYRVSYYEKNQI